MSRYPGFHKHVTKAYLIIICLLAAILPILNVTVKKPSIRNLIGIFVCVVISYVVYWLIVRLNCYGTPLTGGGMSGRDSTPNSNRNSRASNNNNNNNNNNGTAIYTQSPRSNSSTTSTHSSSNGGTNNQHPTFDSYRFGGFAEIFRRFGGNNGVSTASDDEINCEVGEVLRPPPPTYNTALKGAGLPPPYMNDSVDINIHNSESPQMSERYVPPRRPVPSVPSSSSPRRSVPLIPQQQQSSTQSTQDTSQDPSSPIISDSSPRRPVPPIPQSSERPLRSVTPISTSPSTSSSDNTSQKPRRPAPPAPTSSSSTLPPRSYKNISHE